jgi:hypothetical protein
VLDGFASVALTAQEDGVRAGRGAERKLVERDALAACGQDARPGGRGEAERRDRELGQDLQADVVGDGADDDDDLRTELGYSRGLGGDLRERDGRAVDLREEEAAEDGLQGGALNIGSNLRSSGHIPC